MHDQDDINFDAPLLFQNKPLLPNLLILCSAVNTRENDSKNNYGGSTLNSLKIACHKGLLTF